jgi:metal-sulfur cluster biosynthetic enzyme
MNIDIEAVRAAAGSTPDPEVRCSIAELGLLDEITVAGSNVTVHYHLTSPLCPAQFATKIGTEIRRRVMAVPGVEACEVVIQDHFLRDAIQQQINRIPGRRSKGQPLSTQKVDP